MRVDMMHNQFRGSSTRDAFVVIASERGPSALFPFLCIWLSRPTSPKVGATSTVHPSDLDVATTKATRSIIRAAVGHERLAADGTCFTQGVPIPSMREITLLRAEPIRSRLARTLVENITAALAGEAATLGTPGRLSTCGRKQFVALGAWLLAIRHVKIIADVWGKSNNPEYAALARRRIDNPRPEPEVADIEGQMTMWENDE